MNKPEYSRSRWAAVALAVLLAAAPARAWHGRGHRLATMEAVAALDSNCNRPQQAQRVEGPVPAFFILGADMVAHCSLDPDTFCKPMGQAQVQDAEAPEHYCDIEKLEGQTPPPLRYDYLALCARKGLDPRTVGLLPYAVTEWTQRLAVAFAEHRQWPDNPYIRQKCLVYAGILSHYAEDLCQPLHTTIHHDGRARPDGSSPRTGIHNRVDALLGKLAPEANNIVAGVKAEAYDNIMAAVMREFNASHALVEQVYAMEKSIPAYDEPLDANTAVGRFTGDRLRACVRFTASLYLTAWKESQKIEIPAWHQREGGNDGRTDGNLPAANRRPVGDWTADPNAAHR